MRFRDIKIILEVLVEQYQALSARLARIEANSAANNVDAAPADGIENGPDSAADRFENGPDGAADKIEKAPESAADGIDL